MCFCHQELFLAVHGTRLEVRGPACPERLHCVERPPIRCFRRPRHLRCGQRPGPVREPLQGGTLPRQGGTNRGLAADRPSLPASWLRPAPGESWRLGGDPRIWAFRGAGALATVGQPSAPRLSQLIGLGRGRLGHGPEAGDPGRQPLGEPVLYLTFVRSAYLTPGRRDTPAGTK